MDESATLEVNTDYLKVLQEHVDLSYDHLNGFIPAAGISYASYFPCRSFWSAEEKDVFFHGLSMYSRLRPDLIAAHLPNKTVVDVSLFLDLLEEASKEERRGCVRNAIPPALEVSEKWIKWEEEQARRISINQPFWEDRSRHKERARSARVLWPSSEVSKRRKVESDVEDEKTRYDEIHGQWKKEDYLKDLSVLHLRAIDHILRDSEDPSKVLGEKDNLHDIEDEDDHPSLPMIDDSCIDPTLLESTTMQKIEDSDVIIESTHRRASHPPPEDGETIEDPQSLTPRARRRYQKRLYMRRKRAAANGAAPSATVSRLKPGRKSNKKVTIVTTDVPPSQMFPEHHRHPDANAPLPQTVEDDREGDIEADRDGQGEGDGKLGQGAGGTTPHYRIIKELTEMGIDASTLAADRLDLFHLSNIGKLMEIYASLDDSLESTEIGSCISASAIQLFHALVVHFVTETIGKSISMREQEQALKEHTKVWRMKSGQIPVSTVREAIDLMGTQRSVKHHFKSLYKRASGQSTHTGTTPGEDHDSETEDDDGGGDDHAESTEKSKSPFLLSAHREVYGPVVRLVPFTTTSKQYLPFLNPAETNAAFEMDTELMSEETDEEELLVELYDEEDIDKADEILAQEAETELWTRVQVDVPAAPAAIPTNHTSLPTTPSPKSKSLSKGTNNSGEVIKGDGNKLRFANPSRTGIVKSAVYVDDSD